MVHLFSILMIPYEKMGELKNRIQVWKFGIWLIWMGSISFYKVHFSYLIGLLIHVQW